MTDPTLTNTPALARTDAHPGRSAAPSMAIRSVRRIGLGLAAGTTIWAGTIFAVGLEAEGLGARIGDLGGLAFQLGLFGLLTVMLRTRATGTSRASVLMLKVQYGLLGLAGAWSLLHATVPASVQTAPWMEVLDIAWPLSMLAMLIIAITVAVAGRWTGLLRWWPMVAETWFIAVSAGIAIFGEAGGDWVAGAHLLVGYALLGALIARMPHRTGGTR